MADRSFHKPKTQGVDYVNYDVSIRGFGVSNPVFVEGDTAGQPTGSYLKMQRGPTGLWGVLGLSGAQNPTPYPIYTGITGCYYMITRDPFVAVVTKQVNLSFHLGNGDYSVQFGQEFQERNGIWVIPFYVFLNAAGTIALADLPAGAANKISMSLCFRNSNVTP